ncbi:DNA methylase N-4/N-6 domain protein, partial [mine drainage metagenome]
YLVNYRDRDGRSIQNDSNAVAQASLRRGLSRTEAGRFLISFYSWTKVDMFLDAWRSAGFRVVGHLVFRKAYSSKARFLKYQHEQAYLLAKSNPALPERPIADVIDMPYSGNKLHPNAEAHRGLLPLIESFSQAGSVVLDPFCGSGSTLVAAK